MIRRIEPSQLLDGWLESSDAVHSAEREYAMQQVMASSNCADGELSHAWVATVDGRRVGFSALRVHVGPPSVAKFYCNVVPNYRRSRIGVDFMQCAVSFARERYPALASIRADSQSDCGNSFLRAVGAVPLRSTVGLSASVKKLARNAIQLPECMMAEDAPKERLREVAAMGGVSEVVEQLNLESRLAPDVYRVSYVASDRRLGYCFGLSTARVVSTDLALQEMTWVRPEWRRRGIASALKTLVAMAIMKSGVSTGCVMKTDCESTNRAAIRLNTSLGFERDGRSRSTWTINLADGGFGTVDH